MTITRTGSRITLICVAIGMAACGGGSKRQSNPTPPPPPPPATSVTISGKVNYEFVPPNNNCAGLNFAGTFERPIRGAPVQLIDAGTQAVLGSTVSDDAGNYSFANISPQTMVQLRVRAELKKTSGASTWDVEVRDNFDDSGSPPALGSRPLYVTQWAAFDSGTNATNVVNRTAVTGWGGSSYTGDRAAAPFAILDSIYSAVKFVESVDPNVDFPPLDAFWSVNNSSDAPDGTDIDAGELGTSFYRGGVRQLFLLGDASSDTEEFDDHVIVHEWGHFFEDAISRSDSIGGPHRIGEKLDARLAFGEGWATAFAGMALDNHLYCDTGRPGSNAGFGIGAESGSYDAQGWYDEISVVRFIYDLYDDNDEGGDSGSLGFAPIYSVMTGPQVFSSGFTSVFSFAAELRSMLGPADQAFLDAQLVREDMTPGADIYGAGEANDAGGDQVIPIYTDLAPNGQPETICTSSQFDSRRDGNKLSEHRYIRVDITAQSQHLITVNTVNPPSTPSPGYDCTTAPITDPEVHEHSDPDIVILRNGTFELPLDQFGWPEQGWSCQPNSEIATTNVLTPGIHVISLNEFRFADPDSPAGFPNEICFDISIEPTP